MTVDFLALIEALQSQLHKAQALNRLLLEKFVHDLRDARDGNVTADRLLARYEAGLVELDNGKFDAIVERLSESE